MSEAGIKVISPRILPILSKPTFTSKYRINLCSFSLRKPPSATFISHLVVPSQNWGHSSKTQNTKSESWIYGSVHFSLAAPLHKLNGMLFYNHFSSFLLNLPSPIFSTTPHNLKSKPKPNEKHTHTHPKRRYFFFPFLFFSVLLQFSTSHPLLILFTCFCCLSCPVELSDWFTFRNRKNGLPLVSMSFDVMYVWVR